MTDLLLPDPPVARELFLLRPDVVFLNHGSFGACPRPVFEQYQSWQLELERQPVDFLGRRFPHLMREAREGLAGYLGARAEDLLLVPNATTGLNIVARSIHLAPGDEVLTSDHEYGAMHRMWRFLCEKQGARYVHQHVPLPMRSKEEVVEAIWEGVTPRTRVLFLSHITSPTAVALPIEPLVRRAREAGILTVIDGAHGPGQLPLNLEALGSDFYAGNAHKWMMAPKGAAFLHVRREQQPLIEPLVISWGSDSPFPPVSPFINEQEFQGTRDIAAFLTIPAAIDFMERHDWPSIQRWCHEVARYGRQRITAVSGLPPLSPDSPEWFQQMVSLPLPPCDWEALREGLYGEYSIEVPIFLHQEQPLLRICIQGYNSRSEVETLVHALEALLPTVLDKG